MAGRSALVRLATATAIGASSAAGIVALAAPAHAVTSDASAYLAALNQERTSHGLPALALRSDLTGIAQGWANHMADAATLSHNPNLGAQVSNWKVVGENVGEGPSISSLTSAFWNSAPHRANILDGDYKDVGIGTTTADGIIWITVDFRDPMHAVSASTATASPTTTPAAHHRTLHVGSRGRDVARVQRRLHIHADGIFGPQTRRAVIRFQHRHRLHANGVVGARTWKALHL